MKKIILLAMIVIMGVVIIVLSALKIFKTETVYQYAKYNGNIYELIVNWHLTGTVKKIDIAQFGDIQLLQNNEITKKEKEIELYDEDPTHIFFTYEYRNSSSTNVYHRVDDPIPLPYAENAKIFLEINPENINDDELSNSFKLFLKQCIIDSDTILKAEPNNVSYIGAIKIYYDNYPAYQSFGQLGIYSDNLLMRVWEESKYIFYILPDSLSDQIKRMMEN